VFSDNFGKEDSAVDMDEVIVGPPGYGSPDPRTVAGRLVPLSEHPLKDEIAKTDYGSEVTHEEVMQAFPEGALEPSGGMTKDNLEDKKKAELVSLAEQKGLDASGMTKAELVDALAEDSDEG
jgi:hypothetical protein